METKVCNFCGKELDEFDEAQNFTIDTTVGYGSKYDMTAVKLRLCNHCFDMLAGYCEVSPVVEELDHLACK